MVPRTVAMMSRSPDDQAVPEAQDISDRAASEPASVNRSTDEKRVLKENAIR
jgi:hypothetical protein